MRTPGTQGSRDALNWCKVINGLGGRNASQLIALGVIAIVLSIMTMIIAPRKTRPTTPPTLETLPAALPW